MIRSLSAVIVAACLLVGAGCIKPRITVFPDRTEPLEEYTLQGKGDEKILVISVKGFISDGQRGLPFARRPGTVQEVVSQLKKAEKDKQIKAVILKIDSPGGSVTASDMLYHEITRYRERSGARVVAMMMSVAASGGYYVALPADFIMAHPTSITGSIGVVFLRPNITGLMGKIGLDMEVDKSGQNKDMGSPFRATTPEERRIMQKLIDDMAERFIGLAVKHRRLSGDMRAQVSSGRIYAADEALRLGLIDRIGYLDDALREGARMSGLPEDAKVVVYHRAEYHDDNIYNTSAGKPETPGINLIDLGIAEAIPPIQSGLYYLWLPGSG
ncbi:MAG: signal peptide peptidase SppA [Syntrophobacteraceae bacterium]